MLKVYGIKNCDTVKKALRWLDENEKEYEFIDFKKSIPTKTEIMNWKKSFGDWPVNRRGRTFKAISDEFDQSSSEKKIQILQDKTSAIKRPIVIGRSKTVFGFDPDAFDELR